MNLSLVDSSLVGHLHLADNHVLTFGVSIPRLYFFKYRVLLANVTLDGMMVRLA